MARRESAEANLDMTPFLGLVYLLIGFFMVITNFKAAALDLNMKLPVVGSARPVETGGQQSLLILNIRPIENAQGEKEVALTTYGAPRFDVENYIAGEAQASLLTARRDNPDLQAGDELPTTVVIRADQTTPFRLLDRVIRACQENGFRNFALKARDPNEK